MKKNIIALAILTTVSSAAVASNAVLNVEGQIQINGETVIGSDGKVVASALPSSDTVTVNLSKYAPKPGSYTYQFETYRYIQSDDYWGEQLVICTDTDEFTSDSSYEYTQECKFEGAVVSWFVESWQDNGDGTETIKFTQQWLDQEVTSNTRTYKLDALTNYTDVVQLGTTTSYAEKGELLSSDSDWYEVGEEWFYARTKSITGFIDSVTIGENTFNDCVMMTNTRNWNGIASSDIYCSDVGLVRKLTDTDWERNYQLLSYTVSNTASARSLSKLSGAQEKVSDKARSRVAQRVSLLVK